MREAFAFSPSDCSSKLFFLDIIQEYNQSIKRWFYCGLNVDSMYNNITVNQYQQNHHNGGSVDVDSWLCCCLFIFVAARIVCGTLFWFTIASVLTSFTIVSLRKSERVVLL